MLDFFIVGVQKGGTTAIDAILRQNQAVQMARQKEVHFFDNEVIDWSAPDYTDLHNQFDWSRSGVVRGEATPIYSYWPNSLERIAQYNPGAKIVVCLRHPVFRAYSHWKMETKRNYDCLPFSIAVSEGRGRISDTAHRIFSYVERGFYAPQMLRVNGLFEHVHYIRTDVLWRNPETEVARLAGFLGVVPNSPSVDYIVPVDTTDMPSISAHDYFYLLELYTPDLEETMRLTGLDLRDWLKPTYTEPMKALVERE